MSVINSIPKKINILGGGTAGWMAASLFHKAWDYKGTEILLIESDVISKIGVGEGSTPSLRLFFNHLGISEQEWMPECNATYKCGISFPGWTSKDDPAYADFPAYIHPFYSQADWKTGNAFMHNARLRRQGFDVPAHPDDYWLQSYLAKHFKGPIASQQLRYEMDYGYHFDSALVGSFLKKRLLNKGLNHLVDTVSDVKLNDSGKISSVITKNNGTQSADIFIDCSGFKRLLIGNKQFKSYENNLLVNRALTFNIKDKEVNNYTHARAMNNGWMWEIPLQERKGCGYVFSDNHTTPDEAHKEIEETIGQSVEIQKDIKFNSGRIDNVWFKNILSTGLSSGFVEPLEATSIHMTVVQINHFIEQYFTETMDIKGKQQEQYNEDIRVIWDDIKDFIQLHYQTPRQDTLFWKDASSATMSDTLKDRLDIWKGRMPRYVDYGRNNFYELGNTLWYQILIGMKILDKNVALEELKSFKLLDYAKELQENSLTINNKYYSSLITNKEYYVSKK